ncbi:Phosphatidylinositol-4-phosphate 5-kinase [Saitoella coloradoensis]
MPLGRSDQLDALRLSTPLELHQEEKDVVVADGVPKQPTSLALSGAGNGGTVNGVTKPHLDVGKTPTIDATLSSTYEQSSNFPDGDPTPATSQSPLMLPKFEALNLGAVVDGDATEPVSATPSILSTSAPLATSNFLTVSSPAELTSSLRRRSTSPAGVSGLSSPHPRSGSFGSAHPIHVPPTVAEEGGIVPLSSPRVSTSPNLRRSSFALGSRRMTRSFSSQEMHLDEVPQDEGSARWSESIKVKRESKRRKKSYWDDDDRVLVGTRVAEGHENFVIAYNMLTGIRVGVSRCNAKVDRPLTDEDFEARHKFSFDITGNELTPSAKYDFKFKDYAPWVFRHLRQLFRLDPADYLVSLTGKYILSQLGSPGKSGSFFYFSRDYRFIIKTIHHSEHKFLRRILKDYYNHVKNNPDTLISQFYGLHRVKAPYGRKIHFVIMNNLFPPHRDIHQTFDLKGSTIGRDFREEDLAKNPRATLKDLNWIRRDMHLSLGPTKGELFLRQVKTDVDLLSRLNIMDYSLLIGIHDLTRGNKDHILDNSLSVFHPESPAADQSTQLQRVPSSRADNAKVASALRKVVRKAGPVRIGKTVGEDGLPNSESSERKSFVFYADDGGCRATNESNEPGDVIYYLGIIDLLTKYDKIKKIEHFWKGLSNSKSQISAVPPSEYAQRFFKFISAIVKTPERLMRERRGLGDKQDPEEKRIMERAELEARREATRHHHKENEEDKPERTLRAMQSPIPDEEQVLPVINPGGEGRDGDSGRGDSGSGENGETAMNEKDTTVDGAATSGRDTGPLPVKRKVGVSKGDEGFEDQHAAIAAAH